MRRIIAGFKCSLDGFVEGPSGQADWVDAWDDAYELVPQVDTCVLGAGMFPGYGRYWSSIAADPGGVLFTGKRATAGEVAYAEFAVRTPHVVLSKTLQHVELPSARIVRDLEQIAGLKQQPGKDIFAVGGPTFVGSLMRAGLLDELRLIVYPLLAGGGKPLFKDLSRRPLKLERNDLLTEGRVRLRYVM